MQKYFRGMIHLFFILMVVGSTACKKLNNQPVPPPDQENQVGEAAPTLLKSPLDSNTAMNVAIAAIKNHQLTQISIDCLSFEEKEDDQNIEYFVHEKHDSKCGGLPGTGPGLFSIQVNKKSGQVSSDAKNLEGEMEVLN